jgi:uncharacterized membrane protein
MAVMPMGGFLDSLPPMLYIAAHILFLIVGVWAWSKASRAKNKIASAFWLYVIAQVVFLGFFGGIITMKMAVLVEQTLMVIMVIWIANQKAA